MSHSLPTGYVAANLMSINMGLKIVHRYYLFEYKVKKAWWAFSRSSADRADLWAKILLRQWPKARRLSRMYRITLARSPRVVTVIGSLGKTTTARAVSAALGLPAETINGNNEYTYVALALLRILPWQRHGVIEVGIGGKGQMVQYSSALRPDIVVVTSIASEHILSLGSLEEIREEKSVMVRGLSPSGVAVLNGDDPHVVWMKNSTMARVITFGFGDANDVRASDLRFDWPFGMRFRIHATGTTREARTRFIGRTFVYSTLAAVAVALAEGCPLDLILARLEGLQPTPERLQPLLLDNGAWLLRDDFKSTLETVDVALDVLEQIPARRKFVILGGVTELMENQGPVYRRLGARVAGIADSAIFWGTKCQPYASGAARAGLPRSAITKADLNFDKALAAIPLDLGQGDVVLIKGKPAQRLGRFALVLMGRKVTCKISSCTLFDSIRCDRCDLLERGEH